MSGYHIRGRMGLHTLFDHRIRIVELEGQEGKRGEMGIQEGERRGGSRKWNRIRWIEWKRWEIEVLCNWNYSISYLGECRRWLTEDELRSEDDDFEAIHHGAFYSFIPTSKKGQSTDSVERKKKGEEWRGKDEEWVNQRWWMRELSTPFDNIPARTGRKGGGVVINT